MAKRSGGSRSGGGRGRTGASTATSRASRSKVNTLPKRRTAPKGQSVPRKVYPTITAEQRKNGLAPKVGNLISKHRQQIIADANQKGALDSENRLTHPKMSGKAKSAFGNLIKNASNPVNIGRLSGKHGVSRADMKKRVSEVHKVKCVVDPDNK